jgi:hypothetical protein
MTKLRTRMVAIGLVLGTLAWAPAAWAQSSTVLVEWNQVLQTLSPVLWRPYAILHIAMFDAVNAIEHAYTPYRVHLRASGGASREAAAAQAAHDVLSALFPAQQTTFQSLLESQLKGIPPGRARQGRAIGHHVAREVLAWRATDGWPATIAPDPTYVLPPLPGLWQPTPPANSFPTFTFYPQATPFALLTPTLFLPPPPPALASERYATDFNETKAVGSASSVVRTPEQTLLAQLFAGVNALPNFVGVWNNVARDVAASEGLSLVDTARLFALVNVSLNDGLQTSFTSKFIYDLWRPVTAIRQADQDFNDATVADADWTPLLATPPYPTYAGNAACLSAAASRVLALALGHDDVFFSVTWVRTTGLPNETRHYTGFAQLAEQQARSRIHGGIHFQFDSDASRVSCTRVAEYIFANYMRPR